MLKKLTVIQAVTRILFWEFSYVKSLVSMEGGSQYCSWSCKGIGFILLIVFIYSFLTLFKIHLSWSNPDEGLNLESAVECCKLEFGLVAQDSK